MLKKAYLYNLIFLLLAGSAPASETTEAVWSHHIEAWSARDLDAIVSDYSEESVVILNGDVYRGTKDIRALFRSLFETFDHAKDHQIAPAKVIGKIVYITWEAHFEQTGKTVGTDTFVIVDGKIHYQTIAAFPKLF